MIYETVVTTLPVASLNLATLQILSEYKPSTRTRDVRREPHVSFKTGQWGAQLIVLDSASILSLCQWTACLPALGPAMQPTVTALTGMHLKWHFTNCQPQISELQAQLQVSAARTKPWQWLVTQRRQQMFLSLTVADLTSHLTAGTALLGLWLQGWGKELQKPASQLLHFLRPPTGVRARKGWLQRPLANRVKMI